MSKAKRDKNGLRLDVVICAWCKRYMDRETKEIVDAPDDIDERDRFSHTICPDCYVEAGMMTEGVIGAVI